MEIEIRKIFPASRPENGRSPWITAALYLDDGRILIADYNNPRALVYDEDGVLLKELALPGNPRDLTRFAPDMVIMTLPNELMLQTMNLESIKITDWIHIGYECLGITKKDDNALLSCGKHITMVTIKGEILRSLKVKYGNAVHICCDGDKIFYTGYKIDALYCIDMEGKVIYTFESIGLKFYRGVTLDGEGNAFVVGRWTHNIAVITPEGNLKSILMGKQDGLDFPLFLNFRETSLTRFLVLNNNGKNIMICETVTANDKDDESSVVNTDHNGEEWQG